MPRIVAIHGIGQQLEGPETQTARWGPALRSGVQLAHGPALAQDDLRLAFYGDLFRKSGSGAKSSAKASGELDLDEGDIESGFETDLLFDWARATGQAGAARDLPVGKVRTPMTVQRALSLVSKSAFFAGVAERVVVWNLWQVRLYFLKPHVRQEIAARVIAAVDEDTRVLVGHSLGSVVAYEALAAHPEWPARTLVTLGSPLGTPNLVFDRLIPAPTGGRGAWPGSVERWSNIADSGDVVALTKKLAPLFGDRVQDIPVHNGSHAHDVSPYLTAIETGEAITAGLAG
jgi:hypothetical protein